MLDKPRPKDRMGCYQATTARSIALTRTGGETKNRTSQDGPCSSTLSTGIVTMSTRCRHFYVLICPIEATTIIVDFIIVQHCLASIINPNCIKSRFAEGMSARVIRQQNQRPSSCLALSVVAYSGNGDSSSHTQIRHMLKMWTISHYRDPMTTTHSDDGCD